MNRFATLAAVLAIIVLAALSFAAPLAALETPAGANAIASPTIHNQDGHGDGPVTTQGQASDQDVIPRVKWMLAGIFVGGYALSMLYLLKRRLGGFPENPGWVAPITIMPSSQLPGDTDPHAPDNHGHAVAPGH